MRRAAVGVLAGLIAGRVKRGRLCTVVVLACALPACVASAATGSRRVPLRPQQGQVVWVAQLASSARVHLSPEETVGAVAGLRDHEVSDVGGVGERRWMRSCESFSPVVNDELAATDPVSGSPPGLLRVVNALVRTKFSLTPDSLVYLKALFPRAQPLTASFPTRATSTSGPLPPLCKSTSGIVVI